ncbi:TonB-dependent receptor [Vreelandella utahensis]|uniref:TonB-dependent receptor n=1 Tax=Vreelandella halophila TaxID=86177 RepID=UPI003BF515CA
MAVASTLSPLWVMATAASAQTEEGSFSLSPLTISATRGKTVEGESPQKITVITREQIERQQKFTQDRGQILNNLIPGYSPGRQKLTNSGETFRGREALIMVDGVPQSNPLRDSARDGYTIDLNMVERIEVIHGASAEHGLGATGGIINYVTRRPESGQVNQHAGARVTTDDGVHGDGTGYKLDYQVSGQQGDWDYLTGVTWHERGLFYDGKGRTVGIDEISGEVQDSSSYDLFTKLGHWLDDEQNVEFSVNHFNLEGNNDYVAVPGDRDRKIPTTSRKGTPTGDAPFNRSTTANLKYSHGDWRGNQVDAQVYYQRFRAQFGTHPTAFPYEDEAGNERLDQTRTESDKVGAKFTLTREGMINDRLDLTTGVDLLQDETQQMLVQTGRTYVPESQLHNLAAFLQADVAVTDALTLHAGVRHEYARLNVDSYETIDRSDVTQDLVQVDGGSPDFEETLFNAGAVYQVTPGVQVFGNISEGFGIPDAGRVLRSIDQPNRDVDTLVQLVPIVTDNREVGVRFKGRNYGLEVSYYESNSDLGERLTQEGTTFVGKREKVEIQGVDVNGEWELSDAHTLELLYAFNQGESDTDGDGRVDTDLTGFNVAPERLTLKWQALWGERLSTQLQGSHNFSKTFEDQSNPNLRRFHGYTLVDAAMSYRLPVGEASLGIENLLDEDYITYYSQTARDGANQYFAGRGRTFTLGYQVDF